MQISPEMSFGKSMTGAGFEIFFKRICFLIIGELNSYYDSPRYELRRMWGLPSIVLFQSIFQIRSFSNISFFGML